MTESTEAAKHDVAPLAAELAALCDMAGQQGEIPSDMLQAALDMLADRRLATRHPDGVHLPQADQYASICESIPSKSLSQALLEAGPAMRWNLNPNYRDIPAFARYHQTSTYCMTSGLNGLVKSESVSTGLLLMGPDTPYPSHHHPHPEGYIVISGRAWWWRGGEDWIQRSPNDSLYHKTSQPHAMRTESNPLLVFFVATGSIEVRAIPGTP